MAKNIYSILLFMLLCTSSFAQLVVYPALTNNKLKSTKYSVRVKLGNGAYQDSYTNSYIKNSGTGSSQNNTIDPYNIVTAPKRDILSNNHWTTVSYNNNGESLTFEVSLVSGNITTCEVYPKRYNLTKTISGGKAFINVDQNEKYIYLVINNDKKDAMFLFVDPLETNIPTSNTPGVAYFGPGLHEIGERWQIPSNVNKVYIAGGAYVRGTIEANNRSNIIITGRGILSGEGYDYRDGAAGIPWGAVYLNGNGTNQVVEGITSIKPLHFHITSRGGMTVRNIKCFSYNNTTDGVVGGEATLCENSFFKVNDDVTKLYSDDMIFQDLVVYHQTNTPCFQFGWSGQSSRNCTIRRVDIVEDNHVIVGGGGIIGWANSDNSSNYQTGHVWTDIRADQGVSYIMDVNSGGSQGKVDITLNDFSISSTESKSQLGGGDKKVVCNNVKINGKCVEINEWSDGAGRVTINCNSTPTNSKPIVSFTSPANNATFTAGSDVNVKVNATDPDGTISLVKLYVNDILMSRQLTVAPYEWAPTGLTNDARLRKMAQGVYTLKTVAYDNDGDSSVVNRSFTISAITGFEEFISVNEVKLYPNPVIDYLKIDMQNSESDWQLFNSQGQLVLSGSEKLVSFVGQPAGIYTLKIGENKFKIIKN
jgi:hypothetical protein